MRLPIQAPLTTRDGEENKDSRLTNMLVEQSEVGTMVGVRPGLYQTATAVGNGHGLVAFNDEVISVYGAGLGFVTRYPASMSVNTPIDINLSGQISDVVYGNGVFVAIASGASTVSPDGVTWLSYSLPTVAPYTNSFWRIAFNGTVFCAVSNSNVSPGPFVSTVTTSSDGQTWNTPVALPVNNLYIQSIASIEGVICIMARGPSPNLTTYTFTSSDNGVTWETHADAFTKRYSYLSLTGSNNRFVAVGFNSFLTNTRYQVATSTDGVTWTEGQVDDSNGWEYVSWVKDRFIAISTGKLYSYEPSFKCAYSFDGITWNVVPTEFDTTASYGAIAATPEYLCVINDAEQILVTDTGFNWEYVGQAPANSFDRPWPTMAYGDGVFMVIGSESAGYNLPNFAFVGEAPNQVRSLATLEAQFFDFAQSTL